MIYVKMTKREWFANELVWCAIATAAFFAGLVAGSQL
jgi:hypothetical protein